MRDPTFEIGPLSTKIFGGPDYMFCRISTKYVWVLGPGPPGPYLSAGLDSLKKDNHYSGCFRKIVGHIKRLLENENKISFNKVIKSEMHALTYCFDFKMYLLHCNALWSKWLVLMRRKRDFILVVCIHIHDV